MRKVICKCCGKEFESKGPNVKYCSVECRNKDLLIRQGKFQNRKCLNCGKEFETSDGRKKFCCGSCRYEYELKQKVKGKQEKKCLNCGKEFEAERHATKYCSKDCQKINESIQKYKDIEGSITCKECGFMGNDLIKHIKLKHGSVEEYCQKYNCKKEDLISKTAHENRKNAQLKLIEEGRSHCFTSENNPSKGEECKNGRNSPYSMNFRGYDGLDDEEKEEKINALCKKSKETMNENNNNPLTLEYYIKRGYSKSKAEEMLKERQTTFSLEKCIEKYGKEEGEKIWKERQEKWLKNYKKQNFSWISQKLFWELYEVIGTEYYEIYFATFNSETKERDLYGSNYEYSLKLSNGIIKPDFYIKDNKKIIEFDGDYWHNQEKRGNKHRDEERDKMIIEDGYKVFHVKERDYNENPEKVIQECIEFIKS